MSLANPKSQSLTTPEEDTITFSGFTSRWMIWKEEKMSRNETLSHVFRRDIAKKNSQ